MEDAEGVVEEEDTFGRGRMAGGEPMLLTSSSVSVCSSLCRFSSAFRRFSSACCCQCAMCASSSPLKASSGRQVTAWLCTALLSCRCSASDCGTRTSAGAMRATSCASSEADCSARCSSTPVDTSTQHRATPSSSPRPSPEASAACTARRKLDCFGLSQPSSTSVPCVTMRVTSRCTTELRRSLLSDTDSI